MALTDMPQGHNFWPWENFTPDEMACRCGCGEIYYSPFFYGALQALRDDLGKPLVILSAHRCALHNARVGGAPLSRHLMLAVDIDLRSHDRLEMARAAKRAGFTGFGYYRNFLHLDMGRKRFWCGDRKAGALWAS